MQPEISDIFKTSIYRNILNVNTNLLNDYCFNLQKIKLLNYLFFILGTLILKEI